MAGGWTTVCLCSGSFTLNTSQASILPFRCFVRTVNPCGSLSPAPQAASAPPVLVSRSDSEWDAWSSEIKGFLPSRFQLQKLGHSFPVIFSVLFNSSVAVFCLRGLCLAVQGALAHAPASASLLLPLHTSHSPGSRLHSEPLPPSRPHLAPSSARVMSKCISCQHHVPARIRNRTLESLFHSFWKKYAT